MTCYIKENSWIARLAAKKLRSAAVAIVIGRTIHLHNATKEQFLKNQRWLRHEVRHIRQFQEHGFIPFIFLYLLESLKKGYRNNKYEVEARLSENDDTIVTGIIFG